MCARNGRYKAIDFTRIAIEKEKKKRYDVNDNTETSTVPVKKIFTIICRGLYIMARS